MARTPIAGPADAAGLRRSNLALVLGRLREGARSRAVVAAETGLNKATVSSLVAELLSRGLVAEAPISDVRGIGRPGQPVRLVPDRVAGIGVEIGLERLAGAVVGLDGSVLTETSIPLVTTALEPAEVFDRLAGLTTELIEGVERDGGQAAGIAVAVPGLVDVDAGRLALAPNLGWAEVALVEEVRRRLGRPDLRVLLENDANLAAVAEHAIGHARGAQDLVYLTGEVGVGGGVILGGHLVRGAAGYTGEVGHMPIGSDHLCGCGRVGCWETQVGLAAVLEATADADDPVRDRSRDLDSRLAELQGRAESGEPRTLAGLEQIGRDLGLGASILVNLVNPAVIVLGGYFAVLGKHMIETARAELRSRVIAPDAGRCRLELSTLGFSASILGGAQLALTTVLQDPTLVPHLDQTSAVGTSV